MSNTKGLSGGASTIVVLVLLGGIAWWGHASGWKASRFSQVFGGTAHETPEDWCAEHNVPESRCIACHPELVGQSAADWCKEHGLPESQCTTCHPELLTKGKADDWCREHGLPEANCTLCHPEIAVKGAAPPETGATVTAETGAPPDPSRCKLHLVRVQFASAESLRKAGVSLSAVQERPMSASATAAGETDYDQTRLARLAVRAAGTVRSVNAAPGRSVKAGDVLALVDSAELGRAKAEFLSAMATADAKTRLAASLAELAAASDAMTSLASESLERARTATREGLRTQSDLRDAETRLAEARMAAAERRASLAEAEAAVSESRIRLLAAKETLLNLGIPVRTEDFAALDDAARADAIRLAGVPAAAAASLGASANLLPVVAPFDGVVVSADAGVGETADPSRTLFVVADLSKMRVNLDVKEEDAARIAVGQNVVFRPDGADEAVSGKVTFISTEVGEKTRTLRVRAEVDNAAGRLKAHTFGSGRIVVREAPAAAVVPTESIHWEGCCNVVFVRLTDDIFQTRKVRLGAHDSKYTEIVAGVLPGEVVAAAGSHVLKAELLKSRLGAGCCE